jgi:hypothetical protein
MRASSLSALVLLSAIVLSSSLGAQSSGRILGWSTDPSVTAPGQIHVQDILAKCPPAFPICNNAPNDPGTPTIPIGGSAWDTRNGYLWICDDQTLTAYSLRHCSTQCSVKVVTMDSAAKASGLAISESAAQLWMLETRMGYVGLRPWSLQGCNAVPTRGGCVFPAPTRSSVAGGLALDEARQLLYFTVSEPGVINWTHTLFVAKASSGAACQPICKFPVPHCSLVKGAITGLAYDPWTKQLFATDGENTRILLIDDPMSCKIKDLGCCKKGTPGHSWRGLAWQPSFAMTRFGSGCTGKPCAPCPSPVHELGAGSPSIGNPDFELTLRHGPTNSYGLLLLSPGRCTKGVGFPFLCTAIYPAFGAGPLLFAGGPLQGTQPCDGATQLVLPLPADAGLCGATLCTQWLMVCSGPGFALSNGLEWQITGG